MLILTIRANSDEKILIGDKTTLHIHAINGNQVKIAFDAPRDVEIVRTNAKSEKEI